jgi:hypothetical protein
VTVVIAGAVVSVKIAIKFTVSVFRSNDAAGVGVLQVVTGTETLGISHIDKSVAVVVEAVAASVDLAVAVTDHAENRGVRR